MTLGNFHFDLMLQWILRISLVNITEKINGSLIENIQGLGGKHPTKYMKTF